jgi:hypothetical protein
VLLWKGPIEYLGWMGTSPHWAYVGLVSLAAVLPMALAARETGLLSRRAGQPVDRGGRVFLSVATLMRESIGMMGLMVTAAVVIVLLARRFRPAPLLLVGMLAVLAFTTPRWVVMARDAAFDIQKAERLATHGLSHTLYLGLASSRTSGASATTTTTARRSQPRPASSGWLARVFPPEWQLYLARWA